MDSIKIALLILLIILPSLVLLSIPSTVGRFSVIQKMDQDMFIPIGFVLIILISLIVFSATSIERGTKEFEEKTSFEVKGEEEEPMTAFTAEKTTLGGFINFLKKACFNYDVIVGESRGKLLDAVLNLEYVPAWEEICDVAYKLGIKTKEDLMHKFGPGSKRLHLRAYVDRRDLDKLENYVRDGKISIPEYEKVSERVRTEDKLEQHKELAKALFDYLEKSDMPITLLVTTHEETNWPPMGMAKGVHESFRSHFKKGQGHYEEGYILFQKLLQYKDRIMQEEDEHARYQMVRKIVDYTSERLRRYSKYSTGPESLKYFPNKKSGLKEK
jgi:hypothetical protein